MQRGVGQSQRPFHLVGWIGFGRDYFNCIRQIGPTLRHRIENVLNPVDLGLPGFRLRNAGKIVDMLDPSAAEPKHLRFGRNALTVPRNDFLQRLKIFVVSRFPKLGIDHKGLTLCDVGNHCHIDRRLDLRVDLILILAFVLHGSAFHRDTEGYINPFVLLSGGPARQDRAGSLTGNRRVPA